MKTTCVNALLAVLCLLMVSGCSDKADAPQALENMRSSLLAGDKEAFLDCFEATDKQVELLSAYYDFTSAARQFDQAMRKAYGDDAVTQAMGTAEDMSLENDKWLDELTVQVEGETATATRPGQTQPLRLVKMDGLWKIDPASMFGPTGPGGPDMDQQLRMFQLLTKAVADVRQKIGQPGYSVEKISQELAQATAAAMSQAMGGPTFPNLRSP